MVLANILRTDRHLYKPLPKEIAADARLRQLTRTHKTLVQEKVKLLNQLTSQLKSYYPAALKLFSRLDHKITLAFLERYSTPQKAFDASLEDLRGFFREQGYSHQRKIAPIYEALQQPSLRAPRELEEIHQTIVLSLVAVIRSLSAEVEKLADESRQQNAKARSSLVDTRRCSP